MPPMVMPADGTELQLPAEVSKGWYPFRRALKWIKSNCKCWEMLRVSFVIRSKCILCFWVCRFPSHYIDKTSLLPNMFWWAYSPLRPNSARKRILYSSVESVHTSHAIICHPSTPHQPSLFPSSPALTPAQAFKTNHRVALGPRHRQLYLASLAWPCNHGPSWSGPPEWPSHHSPSTCNREGARGSITVMAVLHALGPGGWRWGCVVSWVSPSIYSEWNPCEVHAIWGWFVSNVSSPHTFWWEGVRGGFWENIMWSWTKLLVISWMSIFNHLQSPAWSACH